MVNKMCKLCFLCIAILLVAAEAAAEVPQIMLVRTQTIQIGGGGSGTADAYCLNYSRRQPESSDVFRHAVGSNGVITVAVGRQPPILLAEAISAGQVRVSGTGSYESLSFENLTNLPIVVSVEGDVALGTELESIDLNQFDLDNPAASEGLQDWIWARDRESFQEELKRLLTTRQYGAIKHPDVVGVAGEGSERRAFAIKRGNVKSFRSLGDGTLREVTVTPGEYRDAAEGDPVPAAAVAALERSEFAKAKYASSDKALFFRVSNRGDLTRAITLQLGSDSVTCDIELFRAFLDGADPPSEIAEAIATLRATTPVVLLRDAFMSGNDWASVRNSALGTDGIGLTSAKLLARFQDAFPAKRWYLDDAPRIAKVNIEWQDRAMIGPDSRLLLIDDSRTLSPADQGIFAGIGDRVSRGRIDVVPFDDPGIQRANTANTSNILVLTGRKNDGLRRLVDDVYSRGLLEERVLVLLSCYDSGDEAIQSRYLTVNSSTRPRTIIFFSEKVHPRAVSITLSQLSDLLAQQDEASGEARSFRELWLEAVGAAESMGDEESRRLRDRGHFAPLRRAILQVSDADFGFRETLA